VVVRQEAHETTSTRIGSDASLEIGLAGSRGDLAGDDRGVLDVAQFGLKGSDDVLEAAPTDMLTVLNSKVIDHGCLLFVGW
jgi:hypothetical protein